MRMLLLYGMAIFYVAAGVNHFVHPDNYLNIMPFWLPWHEPFVFITGAIEIVLGILLLPKNTRRFAGWAIIIFLILVFPANVQMAINYYKAKSIYLWIAFVRLPLQIVLIWWAWQYAKRKKYDGIS